MEMKKLWAVEYFLSEMSPDCWVEMKKDGLKIGGILVSSTY